jgi:hypothetical protein
MCPGSRNKPRSQGIWITAVARVRSPAKYVGERPHATYKSDGRVW